VQDYVALRVEITAVLVPRPGICPPALIRAVPVVVRALLALRRALDERLATGLALSSSALAAFRAELASRPRRDERATALGAALRLPLAWPPTTHRHLHAMQSVLHATTAQIASICDPRR